MLRVYSRILTAFFCVILLSTSSIIAQDEGKNPLYSATKNLSFFIGFGGATFGIPSLQTGILYKSKPITVTGRFLYNQRVRDGIKTSPESIWEASLLAGKTFGVDVLELTISGGIGYVHQTLRGDTFYPGIPKGWFGASGGYELFRSSSLGFPIELLTKADMSGSIALGFKLFGNLNKNTSYAGASVTLFLH